jgi:hypothetical protein
VTTGTTGATGTTGTRNELTQSSIFFEDSASRPLHVCAQITEISILTVDRELAEVGWPQGQVRDSLRAEKAVIYGSLLKTARRRGISIETTRDQDSGF